MCGCVYIDRALKMNECIDDWVAQAKRFKDEDEVIFFFFFFFFLFIFVSLPHAMQSFPCILAVAFWAVYLFLSKQFCQS